MTQVYKRDHAPVPILSLWEMGEFVSNKDWGEEVRHKNALLKLVQVRMLCFTSILVCGALF